MRKTTNRKGETKKWKRKQTGTEQEHEQEDEKGKTGRNFYACYLLTSLSPRSKGRTYIGFTVNPRRRIRQHNGEITSGAFRTKKGRPWEMVFCIYGFPTNVSALQFEWAWQHPMESVAVRQAAAIFKSFSGVANKIKLAHAMLNLQNWQSFDITVNYFSTKYAKHSAVCPSLPKHMKVQVCPMDELPCYFGAGESVSDGEGAGDSCGTNDEEHEKASDESGIYEVNTMELCSWSMDEFPCCHGIEDSSHFDSKEKDGEEEYTEAGGKSRNISKSHANESPADIHGIDKTPCKRYGWFEEYGIREIMDPPTPVIRRGENEHSIGKHSLKQFGMFDEDGGKGQEVHPVQPPDYIDSLDQTANPIATGFSTRTTLDDDLLTLTPETVSKLDWLRGKNIIKEVVADRGKWIHNPALQHEIEIIDLLSPASEARIESSSKKRRVSPVSPLFIDLT